MSLLDPDILIEKARQFARSDDFLGDYWQPALRELCASIDAHSGYKSVRLERAAIEFVNLLVTRTRMAALLRARPEIAETPIAPLVITGLPRSGTTLLHNLLARAPGSRAYRLWELRAPAYAAGAPLDQAKRELAASADALNWVYSRAPAFRGIHPMDASAPDECNWLLRTTFTTPVFAWTNYVPAYDRWLAHADPVPAYRDWLLQLQMLRWRSPGGFPVLKDPGHLWNLDALLTVCPQARIVVLERDLAEAVPSLCSLVSTLQGMECDTPVPAEEIGRYVLNMIQRARPLLAAAREHHAERCLTVAYRDLVTDPLGTVQVIQAWAGRPFTDSGRQRCADYLAAPKDVPAHRYSLEQFGLTAAALPG